MIPAQFLAAVSFGGARSNFWLQLWFRYSS